MGYDVESFNKKINIKSTSIYNWLNGDRMPKVEYWIPFLKILKCNSLDILFKPVIENLDSSYLNFKDFFYKLSNNKEALEELLQYIEILKKHYNLELGELKIIVEKKEKEVI